MHHTNYTVISGIKKLFSEKIMYSQIVHNVTISPILFIALGVNNTPPNAIELGGEERR